MIPHSRSLSLSGLRSVHNARTRFYGVGRDPVFGEPTRRPKRPFPALTSAGRDGAVRDDRLWRADLLDRLETPLTRYRE